MRIIGLSGGIATGKSSVSKILRQKLRIPVIDADEIAHDILEPGRAPYHAVIREFGVLCNLVDNRSGAIDRKKLGSLVFHDKAQLKKLNAITHPAIRKEMAVQVLKHFLRGEPLIVLDVPLLYEGNLSRFVHKVIVCDCPKSLQIKRIQERGFEEDEALARINAQMPQFEKVKLADAIIDTDGPIEDLHEKVQNTINSFQPTFNITPGRILITVIVTAVIYNSTK